MPQLIHLRDVCPLPACTDRPPKRRLHVCRADMKTLPLFLTRHPTARMIPRHARNPRFRQSDPHIDLLAIERLDHGPRARRERREFRMVGQPEFIVREVERRGEVFCCTVSL